MSPPTYTVDALDEVFERNDLPQSSVGAPCPMVLAGEHFLHLAYYLDSVHPYHRPARYDRLRHFVFAFHDSVFVLDVN